MTSYKCHGVSNKRQINCLFNSFLSLPSEKASKLHITGPLRRIHQWPLDSPHKGPVMRKASPCHDIMISSTGQPTNNTKNDLDMSFMVEGEQVNLTLEENPHIPSDFPVILRKNGQFQNWTGQANVSIELYPYMSLWRYFWNARHQCVNSSPPNAANICISELGQYCFR